MPTTNETRHIEWHKTCMCKCRLDESVSSIVNEVIRAISSLLIFLRKRVQLTKTIHKQKPTNKTKLSKQKPTNATIFRAHQKLLKGRKSLVFKLKVFS